MYRNGVAQRPGLAGGRLFRRLRDALLSLRRFDPTDELKEPPRGVRELL